MKIAILTLPLHTNYGGILQAYALQHVLERIGHRSFVIQKTRYDLDAPVPSILDYIIRIVKKYILRKKCVVRPNKLQRINAEKRIKIEEITRKNTWPFIQKYINIREIDGFCQLRENEVDAIIVGSDQIWRPLYICDTLCCSHSPHAFLNFAKDWNIKRISYAASFGVDYWEFNDKDTNIIKNLIKQFDAVSVREKSGIELCKKYLDFQGAVEMIDPTLLLTSSDYLKLMKETSISEGNLHCYILDDTDDKRDIIKQIVSETKLVPFYTNSKTDDWRYPIEDRIQPPLEKWLRGFYDAELVVTDSFHACVFSIIFRKQFIVIANKGRGFARIESLLNLFGIEDRLINVSETHRITQIKKIDYELVHKKLEFLREKAFNFLTSNLQCNA